MALSSARRAVIALAVLALLIAAATGAYFHFLRRPTATAAPEPAIPFNFATPTAPPKAKAVLDELPGDAPAVAYIDAESLRKTPGSALSVILGLTGSDSSKDRDYQQFIRKTGFDYARDLDRAAIAFWPDTYSEKKQNGANANRVFAVAEGRFDQKRIRSYVFKSGTVQKNGAGIIYELPGDPAIALEFLSPNRMAIASGAKPADLLTAPSTPRDPIFQARIDRVSGAPLFAAAQTDKLSDSFYANFKNSPEIEDLVRSVSGLTLAAAPQGAILRVALDAETMSPKKALTITTLLEISRMGASMALDNPKSIRQLTNEQATFLDAIIRQAQINRRDRWVRITLDITPQMIGPSGSESSAR